MMKSKAPLIGAAVFAALILALWAFPWFWYTKNDPTLKPVWLGEQTNLVGWSFKELPLASSAERLLVADRTFSGEFKSQDGSRLVRAFSAKRYTAKPNDVGLFIHTPDRCWTLVGWKYLPVVPDHLELEVHGIRMVFERRIFVFNGESELVYFGGLVGGQPLPYRLDHNLSVGERFALNQAKARNVKGALLRTGDPRLWQRIWQAFRARRQILGPKQFIRVSTPVNESNIEAGDRALQAFIGTWLVPEDYATELGAWLAQKK